MSIIEIAKIKEAGSSNVLLWAIENKADIKSDSELKAIINNDLSYRVTLRNVNMFEVFRLVQEFRNELNIVEHHSVCVPPANVLAEKFPGAFTDPDDPTKQMPLYEVAEHAITKFNNIVQQMATDTDIIRPMAAKMFIPMAARQFDVEIPISFWDLANACTPEESKELFNSEYPSTLQTICEHEDHSVSQMIRMLFVKMTSVNKVNERLEKYVDYIKYAPFNKIDSAEMYKLHLVGFHKYSPALHSTVTCSLFNVNQDEITKKLALMSMISTPLIIEFAIQMPIQMMLTLQNLIGRDMLNVACESSIVSILQQGIIFNQSVTPDVDFPDDTAEADFNNAVNAYRVRLTEANQFTINAINCIAESGIHDMSSVMSLLPSMYVTRAVVRVKSTDLHEIARLCSATSISGLVKNMIDTADKIEADIRSAK